MIMCSGDYFNDIVKESDDSVKENSEVGASIFGDK